jgi:hypothetical protein
MVWICLPSTGEYRLLPRTSFVMFTWPDSESSGQWKPPALSPVPAGFKGFVFPVKYIVLGVKVGSENSVPVHGRPRASLLCCRNLMGSTELVAVHQRGIPDLLAMCSVKLDPWAIIIITQVCTVAVIVESTLPRDIRIWSLHVIHYIVPNHKTFAYQKVL